MQNLNYYLGLPNCEKLNLINRKIASIKTQILYRFLFGSMGRGTVIYSPLLLRNVDLVCIGRDVSILQGARIELVTNAFGIKYTPKLMIGDSSAIEQNLHLTCAEEIIIEENVAIAENVGIFDIWHTFNDISLPIKKQNFKTSPVKIKKGSFIGMGAIIQPGVIIGRNCFIGANSVVTKSIPDYSIAVGVPARVIKKYDFERAQWVVVSK